MKQFSFGRQGTACVLVLFLAACSSIPQIPVDPDATREAYQSRLKFLGSQDEWGFEGRLAVNNGEDGGSGQFSWSRANQQDQMSFHGALGRGAWRLESDPSGAVLELADGRVLRDRTVDDLVRQQFGWQIPIEALEWWVRGMQAPGAISSLEFDDQGMPSRLKQFGWGIELERYRSAAGTMMPHRVIARRDDQAVKLVVKNWMLSGTSDD